MGLQIYKCRNGISEYHQEREEKEKMVSVYSLLLFQNIKMKI